MSLLGYRLNIAVPSPIWPLLVVAGLLTVPAECARIGHPHSIFQGASAAPASPPSEEEGAPHSAADHVHAGSSYLPAWASPSGDITAPPASQSHLAHRNAGVSTTAPATPLPPATGDLPVVEPAAPAAITAFGTTVALIAALAGLLLPRRPQVTGIIAPLSSLLARALDPPPPRLRAVAC